MAKTCYELSLSQYRPNYIILLQGHKQRTDDKIPMTCLMNLSPQIIVLIVLLITGRTFHSESYIHCYTNHSHENQH